MAIDFSLSDRVITWQARIRVFVDEVVIPREQEAFRVGVTDALRVELQDAAKQAGVWAPQADASLGGGGFSFDEGNIHLLRMVASPEQRVRYLEPLVGGAVRSCFAMTEPAPGAGSDPSA